MLGIVPIFQLVGSLARNKWDMSEGCRCRVVRCPLTPPATAEQAPPPHMSRSLVRTPGPPPVDGRQGLRMNGLSRAKGGDEWWLLRRGPGDYASENKYIFSFSSEMRLVAGEYLPATAEVWATWGPRDWGARYCFPREGGDALYA